jgi:phosphatidate cytidylyltransferase
VNIFDLTTSILACAVLLLLGASWVIIHVLGRRPESGIDAAIIETFRRRVRAWSILFATLAAAFLLGHGVTVLLFGLISFWAVREFITITPTRPGDHLTLFSVSCLITPLQFVLVWMGYSYYGWYSIVIPVYAFLFIPAAIALAGDYKRFLERTAKIQFGLLICVYCLSYAPALLTLPSLPEAKSDVSHGAKLMPPSSPTAKEAGQTAQPKLPSLTGRIADTRQGAQLLFFFVLIVQLSDALQYAWSQLPRKHVIVPTINTTRTWEGLLGGTASVMLIGGALCWATPFGWAGSWMAALMSAVISLMGFAGSITMSAIKRDRGVEDYGTLVEGHGGILDRIDSLCFAAPIFFHCTRGWLGA